MFSDMREGPIIEIINKSGRNDQLAISQSEAELPFSAIPIQQYCLNQLTHYSRNQSLQKCDFSSIQMLLDLGEMCNLRYLLIENLKYGFEISVFVNEFKDGPFITVHNKESLLNINQEELSYQIIIHKGVHIQTNQIKLIGSNNERLAEEGYFNDFQLLVPSLSSVMY